MKRMFFVLFPVLLFSLPAWSAIREEGEQEVQEEQSYEAEEYQESGDLNVQPSEEEIALRSGIEYSTFSIVVTEFPAKVTVGIDSNILTDILRREFVTIPRVTVIDRETMEEKLKAGGIKSFQCRTISTAVTMARILDAQKVVMGYVTETDNSFVIFAVVIDVPKQEAEFSLKLKVWSVDQFDNTCRNLAVAIRKHLNKTRGWSYKY